MLKFVIPQPGSATITLHQTGAERPLIFGTSVVADCVDLHKYPDAQSWCPAHRIVEGVDAPLNANGAHDLSALQPGLEWYDLYVDDAPITGIMRELFAVEAGCNEKVLKWARVPVTDENVFASYPPMAVFEFAASMLCA